MAGRGREQTKKAQKITGQHTSPRINVLHGRVISALGAEAEAKLCGLPGTIASVLIFLLAIFVRATANSLE